MTGFQMKFGRLLVVLAASLLGSAAFAQSASSSAPVAMPCPSGLPSGVQCLGGKDAMGAHYLIARPANWNQVLVLHAHGGPLLGEPRAERVVEDLQRWKIVLQAGYAWAGSSFRQGGVAVLAAAEDTERLRQIFNQHVGQARRTVLHGQSWGASVAARGAETNPVDAKGRKAYDAVLLTSGVLAGGTRSYDFRLDLRVVYQSLCNNHPKPDEAQYPLWMGLPADSSMTPAELALRTKECLGLGLKAQERSAEQQRKIQTIVKVIRIPETSIQSHMNWATFHFRDIAQNRTGGGNVFGNWGAVYQGSEDDAALNRNVLRYRTDATAVARFAADTDPTGKIDVPVLSVRGIHDATAFVELQHAFHQTMQGAGTADHLVETFTSDSEHSYLSHPVYPAALAELLDWVDQGKRPSPDSVARRCAAMEPQFGAGCRILPDYRPLALETRVTPRER